MGKGHASQYANFGSLQFIFYCNNNTYILIKLILQMIK